MPFVQTGTSEVFAALGKDPKIEYPIEERLAIQEAILLALEKQFAQAHKTSNLWISDRTPLDLAGYMLSDVQRSTLDGKEYQIADMINDYVRRCILSTNKWFGTVVLVQPGIALVDAPGKARACPVYMEHFNAVQIGLMMDNSLTARHYLIPRQFTNLSERVHAVKHAMLHAYNRETQEAQELAETGCALH